jgi:hypothetical protein
MSSIPPPITTTFFEQSGYGNPMLGVGSNFVNPRNLSKTTIAPLQFFRLAHDIKDWRDAIAEIELAMFPMRVKANRIYIDTQENIFVKSLVSRMKELVLQRKPYMYQIKSGKKIISKDLTQQLEEQFWLNLYREYKLEAVLWGYRLIELGDLDESDSNNIFPKLTFTRNENIRIDSWKGALLTSIPYYVDGIELKNNDEIGLFNHFIPTKSTRGVSDVGYGLYYNISEYAIHLRHIMGWNMDFIENYGQPTRVGWTNKQGKERKKFERFLANATSNQYILLDLSTQDKVEYQMASGAGNGTSWKSYADTERRLEYKLSQLILGHGDAIISMPGKLGGNQTSNKDGFNESLIEQAVNSKQKVYSKFDIDTMNIISIPKFRGLAKLTGSKILKSLFPEGYFYGLENDKEDQEVRRRFNSDLDSKASFMGKFYNAGIQLNDLSDLGNMIPEFEHGLKFVEPAKKLDENRNSKTEIKKDLDPNVVLQEKDKMSRQSND